MPHRRRTWRFWRPDVAAEVDEELAFHLAARVAEYQTQGLTRADAERAAENRFGDVAHVRQQLVPTTSRANSVVRGESTWSGSPRTFGSRYAGSGAHPRSRSASS